MTERSESVVRARAYAKINLSLDVLGRRDDGYHDLRSVMQTVSLCDEIEYRIDDGSPSVSDPTAGADYSLIDRAIAAVAAEAGSPTQLAYRIEKRIPAAAGLGGGSSDCATTLRVANQLLNAGLSESKLRALAAQLGSDVPFFLAAGTVLIEGRGDRMQELQDVPDTWFVLANAGVPVSTAAVFQELTSTEWRAGESTERVLLGLQRGEVIFGGNDLTEAAIRVCPEIKDVMVCLERVCRAERVALTGSGGTVVAMADSNEAALRICGELARELPFVEAAVSISPSRALADLNLPEPF